MGDNLQGGAMQNFLQTLPLKFWTRIFGFSWKSLFQSFEQESSPKFSERIFSGSFGRESLRTVFGANPTTGFQGKFLTPISGPTCGSPPVGVVGCISRSTDPSPPAVKTRVLPYQARRRKDFDPAAFQHLTCCDPPFGVPSRDGSFGVSTRKGPVSLGWSLLTLGSSTSFLDGSLLDPP